VTVPIPTPNQMPGAANAPTFIEPTAPTVTPPAAPPPAADPPTPPPADPTSDNRPPWEKAGEKFDPQRAWDLIQNVKNDFAEYKTRTDPIVAEREQLRRASQTELEQAREDITSLTERNSLWRSEAIRSKAESLAAGKFIDAETAIALIGDLAQFSTDDGIDTPKLTARLEQLAADKPFLVAAPPQPPGFAPNRAQSQSGTGSVPIDAQIKAAQDSGNVMQSIALKQAKYYQNQQNR